LRELYELILELEGYRIVGTANNGEDGVKKYKSMEIRPDITLMDYRMPIKNGLDAAKEILDFNDQSKIIFVSADVSIKERALSIGVVDFIAKPFDSNILITRLALI